MSRVREEVSLSQAVQQVHGLLVLRQGKMAMEYSPRINQDANTSAIGLPSSWLEREEPQD